MKLSVTERGLKENKTPREKTAVEKPRAHPQIILFIGNCLYHSTRQSTARSSVTGKRGP